MGFQPKSMIMKLLRSKSNDKNGSSASSGNSLTLFSKFLVDIMDADPVDDYMDLINKTPSGYFYIAGLYDEIVELRCIETEEAALRQFLEHFLSKDRPARGVICGYKRGDRNMWNLLQDVEADIVDFIPRICRLIESVDAESVQ